MCLSQNTKWCVCETMTCLFDIDHSMVFHMYAEEYRTTDQKRKEGKIKPHKKSNDITIESQCTKNIKWMKVKTILTHVKWNEKEESKREREKVNYIFELNKQETIAMPFWRPFYVMIRFSSFFSTFSFSCRIVCFVTWSKKVEIKSRKPKKKPQQMVCICVSFSSNSYTFSPGYFI